MNVRSGEKKHEIIVGCAGYLDSSRDSGPRGQHGSCKAEKASKDCGVQSKEQTTRTML